MSKTTETKEPKYKMYINTDRYKCARCSKKNWEPGTRNDYMLAINGVTRELYSLKEVIWQLELFRGNSFLLSEFDEEKNKEEHYCLSDEYCEFLEKNTIHYHDRLCNIDRTQYLSGYGYMQGCLNIRGILDTLNQQGWVEIPFKWLYDIRQYDKDMNGCFMYIAETGKRRR